MFIFRGPSQYSFRDLYFVKVYFSAYSAAFSAASAFQDFREKWIKATS